MAARGRGPGLRRRDGQTLPALGAAAFQDKSPVLGAHTHEKPVGAPAAATVWLERTLHDFGSPATTGKYTGNLDSSEASTGVSIRDPQESARDSGPIREHPRTSASVYGRVCQHSGPYATVASPAGCLHRRAPREGARPEWIGSPPEVFHNCGKKCGKAKVFALVRPGDRGGTAVFAGRRPKTGLFEGQDSFLPGKRAVTQRARAGESLAHSRFQGTFRAP